MSCTTWGIFAVLAVVSGCASTDGSAALGGAGASNGGARETSTTATMPTTATRPTTTTTTASAKSARSARSGSTAAATGDDAADVAAVRERLAAHRRRQLEHLRAYAEAGEFPRNETTAPSRHVFRDDDGRLCAVANLVRTDGRLDLVDATVRTQNDLAIADVHGGDMLDWILGSGLTQEELARIQLPAPVLLPVAKQRAAPPPPLEVARVAKTVPEMTAAVRAHLDEVDAELRARTAESLAIAVARYVAARGAG